MEEKQKLTIWLLGGNSTGKTTQSAHIHLMLRELYDAQDFVSVVRYFQEEIDGEIIKYFYTKVSPVSANLGIFNHPLTTAQNSGIKTNACCGTDNLSKKVQIQLAYIAAITDPDIKVITVDAIMATGQFIEFLSNSESKLLTILFDCTETTNFKRLAQRRAVKLGIEPSEVVLAEKTKDNLRTKLKNFRSTFRKALLVSDESLEVSTDELNIEEVRILVLDSILCSI